MPQALDKTTKADKMIAISARISVGLSLLILAVKFYAYLRTNSQAVLSDALESIVNVLASVVAAFVLRAVAEPADEEHPYGHGKLEYFSSAFEGGLIAFAALVIGYGAVRALFHATAVSEIDSGLSLMIVSGFINLLLALHLLSVGKKYKSEALAASGKHVLSDVVTTGGVVGGLFLVKLTGLFWIDPIVAFFVAIHLLREGIKIVRRSIGGLIDEMDKGSLTEFAQIFSRLRKSGMIDIHNMKFIRSGRFHHIDAHLVIPEFWDISKAHAMHDEFEAELIKAYPYDCEVAFHLDPCFQLYCKNCDLQDCQIRQQKFEKLLEFSAESLTKVPPADQPGKAKF